MTITREILERRLAQVRIMHSQNIANANACNGAIQQLEWLLAQLDAADPQSNGHVLPRMVETPATEE